MANIFSISETDFFDKSKIKVIHGVAGRGKSSVVIDYLQKRNIDFAWTTSTNKLKRDASERYGVKASTTCSALFVNVDGRFYLDFKDSECETIIIDEILQTSPRVLDWIEDHRGLYNIIILTDIRQMLAKGVGRGKRFLQEFEELLQKSYVIQDEGKSTKRARNQETKNMIEYLYDCDGNKKDEFPKAISSKRFPVVKYESVSYTENDVFIFHTNLLEDKFYRDQKISDRPIDDMCIPKGSIASRPPKISERIPIMSQMQSERTRSRAYYQLKNCGTPTRYQGSECTDQQKLFFFITPFSVVTNREWYTVISRCWNIDSVVIVVDNSTQKKMTTFKGKKIKDHRTLAIMEGETT